MEKGLTIGRLASQAGVNVETVRFYERKRLITQPKTYIGKYRQYQENDIHRIKFIKKAQELGFSLKEIQELMILKFDPDCIEIQQVTEKKIREIEDKINVLENMKNILINLKSKCKDDGMNLKDCPIINAIEDSIE